MSSEVHVIEGLVVPQLPGWEHAWVPEAKLKDYALSPEDPKGKHKARVFSSMLGIGQEDGQYLREQILGRLSEYEAILCNSDTGYGEEWEVPVPVEGRNERTRYVATKWIIVDRSRPEPKLSTLYVEKSARKLREVEERYACRKAGDAPPGRHATPST
jgi:hypothetical protein